MGVRGEAPPLLGVGSGYIDKAYDISTFAIDCKEERKTIPVTVAPSVKRLGRTPPTPTVKRLSRS